MKPRASKASRTRLGHRRLLVVGCGSAGLHVLEQLAGRMRVFALTSSPQRLPELRAAGAAPLLGDLDRRTTLGRLRGLAGRVMMLAPPPARGSADPRSRHLAALLRQPAGGLRTAGQGPRIDACQVQRRSRQRAIVAKRREAGLAPARPRQILVYASTTGVYGDAAGRRLSESAPVRPASDRARRRVAAESAWRGIGALRARHGWLGLPLWRTSILRIPGIYGPGRLPLERLRQGLPRLAPEDDVYTNHIEITDLARALLAALWRGRPQRVVHAADGQDLKMGDYFDAVADACALPRPPRLPRDQVRAAVSPAMWSFMQESRRLDNRRLTRELRLQLRYETVARMLTPAAAPADRQDRIGGGPDRGARAAGNE